MLQNPSNFFFPGVVYRLGTRNLQIFEKRLYFLCGQHVLRKREVVWGSFLLSYFGGRLHTLVVIFFLYSL